MQQRWGAERLGQGLGTLIAGMSGGWDKQYQEGVQSGHMKLGELALQNAKRQKEELEAQQIQNRMDQRVQGRQQLMRGQTGLTDPQLLELGEFYQSGAWKNYSDEGPVQPVRPDWYTPEVENNYRQTQAVLGSNAVATGNSNALQLGQAFNEIAKRDYLEKMINQQLDPNQVAPAYGSVAGKPTYSQGSQGVLHNYSGNLQANGANLPGWVPKGYLAVDPNNPDAGVMPLPGYQKSNGITMTTPDGSIVQIGGQGMTTEPTSKTTNDLQGDVIGAQDTLRELQSIADTHANEYLTYMGRMQGLAGEMMDKFGMSGDLVQFAADKKAFVNNVKQFFNQYRKEITGAAASEKELQQLMNSLFNEELGPQAFQATFNEFVKKIEANLVTKQQMLQQGISLDAPMDLPQIQAPQVGEIQDGFQYIGGDPADPASWQGVAQ